MTQEQLQQQIPSLQDNISAMKSAGQSDDFIVSRIVKNPNIDDSIKQIFSQAQSQKNSAGAVTDFLAIKIPRTPLFTKEDIIHKGLLGSAEKFVGVEPLGRFLKAKFAGTDPETIRLLEKQGRTEEANLLKTGGVSGRELAGSIIQTGASLALPFAGKALTSGRLLTQAAKGAAVGSVFGGAGAAQQEGASIGQGILVGGLLGGAIPIAGAAIKKVGQWVSNIPEKLYSQIFKQAEDDLAAAYKAGVMGKVNPTLAKEAMDAGLRGNSKTMATYAYGKQLDIEKEVQGLIKNQVIKITNKKGYISLLKTIVNEFKKSDVGFLPERVKNGQTLLQQLQSTKGNEIEGQTALWLRRYLDGMRNTKSFLTDTLLSKKQEALRTAANMLRQNLAEQIPGIKDKMNLYRIMIEAFDNIVQDAARRENARLLNLTDLIIGGGGMAGGFPGTGIGAAMAVRGFQQPFTLTSMGTGINALVQPVRSLTESAVKAGIPGAGRILTGAGISQLEKTLQ